MDEQQSWKFTYKTKSVDNVCFSRFLFVVENKRKPQVFFVTYAGDTIS